jgi:hypothetical protein
MGKAYACIACGSFHNSTPWLNAEEIRISDTHFEAQKEDYPYSPRSSASRTRPRAALSLTLPPGFWNSAFPYI